MKQIREHKQLSISSKKKKNEIIKNINNYNLEELFLSLSSNYDDRGIRDLLFNQMFEIQIKDLVFHLPQIAIMFNRHRNDHIIKLINYFSKKNQIFLFLVYILLNLTIIGKMDYECF